MDILKPKFVLIENVVDILKFSNGFLGRYALSRLINLNCQSRLGITIASCSVLTSFVCVYSYCQTLPSKVCCYSWSFLDFCCEFISETIDLVYLGMQVVPNMHFSLIILLYKTGHQMHSL
jgi:hypothetical protein